MKSSTTQSTILSTTLSLLVLICTVLGVYTVTVTSEKTFNFRSLSSASIFSGHVQHESARPEWHPARFYGNHGLELEGAKANNEITDSQLNSEEIDSHESNAQSASQPDGEKGGGVTLDTKDSEELKFQATESKNDDEEKEDTATGNNIIKPLGDNQGPNAEKFDVAASQNEHTNGDRIKDDGPNAGDTDTTTSKTENADGDGIKDNEQGSIHVLVGDKAKQRDPQESADSIQSMGHESTTNEIPLEAQTSQPGKSTENTAENEDSDSETIEPPISLEHAVLNRPVRDICTIETYTEETAQKGLWVAVNGDLVNGSKKSRKAANWFSPTTRELFTSALNQCYAPFGLGHVDFCTVPMDKTPVHVFVPHACALPNFQPNTFQGRRILLVGDSVTRAFAIGLIASLSQAWGYPYDVTGAVRLKKVLSSFCAAWRKQAAVVCWITLKKEAAGVQLTRAMSVTQQDDVVAFNVGLHYREKEGGLRDSLEDVKNTLHGSEPGKPKSFPAQKLGSGKSKPLVAYFETTPQWFHRGYYTNKGWQINAIDFMTDGEYDRCHVLNRTIAPGLHPLANQFNDQALPVMRGLKTERLVTIVPLWHAFAMLPPVDVLGRRPNDDKLDCTHSCLLRERHIYRILMLQMLVTSLPIIPDAKLEEKRKAFASDWADLTHTIFAESGLDSVSYRDLLKHSVDSLDGNQIDARCAS